EFHELIEGFGRLEELRFQAAGGTDPGPLTWAGLQHIAGQYAARQGWDRSLTANTLSPLLRAALDGNLRPEDAAGPTAPAAPPLASSGGTAPAPANVPGPSAHGDARDVRTGSYTQDPAAGLRGEEEAYDLNTLSGAEGGGGRPRLSRPDAEALAQFRFADDPEAERLAQFRFADDTSDDTGSQDGDPDLTPEEYLDLLFGSAARDDHSPEMLVGTAMALRELARKHTDATGSATGVLGELHGLARRVLGLRPNTPVGEGHLLFLGSLALSASPAELAAEDALASYMRRHDAALGRETRLTRDDGTVRNWTGSGDQVPLLDTYAVEHEDGGLSVWPAQWSDPYVVLAEEHGDSVRLNTPDGMVTLDDAGEFARLVTRDPARHGKSDIVLAFPHEDIESLAQHVADLTGARVWFSEHAPRPSTDWRTGTDRITLGPVRDGVGTVWSSVRPNQDAGSDGDLSDIVGLYENDSEPGDGIQARRAEPLTTTDYGVVDNRGEGVLFRKPGRAHGGWQTPRALSGTEDAPKLLLSEQDYDQTLVTARPALRISSDRTLAVEDDTPGQQVFATREAVDSASVKLARAGMAVRLRTDENLSIVLPTPDGGSRRLFRVMPDFLTHSGKSTEEVCRDFADMLAGNARTSHTVFRAPGGGPAVTAPVNASDGTEVTGTHHLADALGHVADGDMRPETADPAWAASFVRRDDRPTGGDGSGPLPGRAYGSALSLAQQSDPRRGALSDAARRIGVNEHAWAEVGEGYLVQSVAASGAHGQPSLEHNYAKPQVDAGSAYFGYHFATVVLSSEDGSHQVSLENHSRVARRNDRHRRAVLANLRNQGLDDLRETAAQLRQEIGRQEQAGTDEHLTELRGYLDLTFALIRAKQAQTEMRAAPAGSPEHAEAERKFEAATRAAASRVGTIEPVIPGKHLWYMRMYSQRPGESAHDANAELLTEGPSPEANPLTAVVVRGQQALPVSVSFDKNAQQTPEGSRNAIQHLAKIVARTGLWNAANGLPLPDVTVSGQRSARLVGRDLSKVRAEAVAASFRRELADALAALQDGTPQPHLTADRFTVDPVTVRDRRPSVRGDAVPATVEITVDDHRGGPRHVATRGLRGGSPDDGLDPVAEQWPIGRPVTVMRPRFGVDPAFVVPASDVPATGVPTTDADASADTGRGKGRAADDVPAATDPRPDRWYTYARPAESRSEPFRYEVADTGHIRLPGGEEIPPAGWTRFGHDFVHAPTGTLLRGDSGWIGRVANMDTLSAVMADLDQDSAPHRVVADPSALYLVPEDGGDTALRIPLQVQETADSAAPAGLVLTAPPPAAPLLVPTGRTPVYGFNAFPQLVRALHEVAPALRSSWGLPADASVEASVARLGELVQAGQLGLDVPRAGAGLTPRMPGSRPLGSPGGMPTLSIALSSPRPVTDSDGVDRARGAAGTTTADSSFAPTDQGTHSLRPGRQLLALNVPLAAQQPHASAAGTGLNRLRAAAPADRRGTRSHETTVDAVITVEGPEGRRWVTGTAVVRLWENDLLGFGVTPARPYAGVYDVPAMLAGQEAEDLRDWARHPVTDLPAALAAGLDPEDSTARLWLDLGDDPDGSRLARALYAASRTAVHAARPVELVVRTADGPRHWPFAADGTPTDTTDATRGAWKDWREAADAHDAAVAAEQQSAAPEQEYRQEPEVTAEALRDIERALGDRPTQAARRTALRDLARLSADLDTVRRAEGTGVSGSLLGSLSATPPAAPGPRRAPAAPGGARLAPPATVAPGVPSTLRAAPVRPVVHHRADLLRIARRVIERESVRGLSVERCLQLLNALRAELYPAGVRPAVTLDDSAAVRTPSPDGALAQGPGWNRVGSWEALAEAVTAAGPGAAAFVLARRPNHVMGHAWAAYHLGDGGVEWVDLSAPATRTLSSQAPPFAAAEARAALIGPSGQVLPDALPAFLQSSSTTHAVLDAATERNRYAGVGLEVEDRRFFFIQGLAEPDAKIELATAPGLKIVTDWTDFWRTADGNFHLHRPETAPGEPEPFLESYTIGEFVIEPMASVTGERRQSPQQVLDRLERALDGVAGARQGGTPLAELLPASDGWTIKDLGPRIRVLVAPDPGGYDHTFLTQATPGYPADRLRDLQDTAAAHLTAPWLRPLVSLGRGYGRDATAHYVRRLLGRDDVPSELMPFLSGIPDIEEVWGYAWLAYHHVAARPAGVVIQGAALPGAQPMLTKHLLPVASRNPLDRILRALRPRTRAFLAGRLTPLGEDLSALTERARATIARALEEYQRKLSPDRPYFAGFFDTAASAAPSPREHLTAAFTGRTSDGRLVTQQETVGMDDHPQLDTDEGRLRIPLVLPELREFGYTGRFLTRGQVRRAVDELVQLTGQAYHRAAQLHTPLPEDVLRDSVERVLGHPAVQAVADFLALASGQGWPQADGRRQGLLSVPRAHSVAETLGRYALGFPVPADHPDLSTLRDAAERAAVLQGNVPPAERDRTAALLTAIRNALVHVADPARRPEPVAWAPVIVAADGTHVPVGSIALLKHRAPSGRPVGLSSRPAADWRDARRQTYGLLPATGHFTWVRYGSAPAESAPQPLPFTDPYLVGLRGDASGLALALNGAGSAVLDADGLADLLFAADPDLTASLPDRPVLFPAADLTGAAAHDPLERPLLGQAVANVLDRWVWGTAGGYETFVTAPDAQAPARFRLAEGDAFSAFRPEPTGPQLARLAREVTGDPGRAPQVLGHLRALRLVYGPHLEDDRTTLHTLLRGFQALEADRLQRGLTAPLTWGELRQSIAAQFAGRVLTEPAPPVGLPFLLVAAAGRTGTDLELSGLDLTPRHHSPRAWASAPQVPGPYGQHGQGGEPSLFSLATPTTTGQPDPSADLFPPAVQSAPAPASGAPAPRPLSGTFTGPGDPLLAPGTLIRGAGGAVRGRNLTGKPLSDPDLTKIRTLQVHPGTPSRVFARSAPWPDTAYVVAVPGGAGQAWLPDGRVLGPDTLADLLAADPELAKLPADVPVLLVLPYAGDGYQEALWAAAEKLGRTVWGASGDTRMLPDGDRHGPALVDADPAHPVGTWLSVAPARLALPEQDREFTAVDGTRVRESEIETRPLTDDQDRHYGRLSLPRTADHRVRRDEDRFRRFRHLRELVHVAPTGTGPYEERREPVAPPPAGVYLYAAHGDPGRMQAPLRDGRTVWLDKHEAARYIGGLREVRALPPGHRMHLEVCWSATDGDPHQSHRQFAEAPHVDDPLADVPLGQLVANATGRVTDASTRHTGLDDRTRLAMSSARGTLSRRVLFRPEPDGAALDRLARDGGLHTGSGPVPERTRRTALRLVRALRQAYGSDVETDPARHARLWQGIAALDRLRANDPALSTATPFRMDLWDFFTEQHTGRAPDPAGRTALLDHARAVIAADPAARLGTAVPSPALELTLRLRQLAGNGEAVLRYVQNLPADATPTPRHWASTLWATVRAAHRLSGAPTGEQPQALGRRILHLPDSAPWTPARQQEVWALTARAAAEGLDIGDTDVLAAYHLASNGAFGPATELADHRQATGVNWSGSAAPHGVDWGSPLQTVPGPAGGSRRPSVAPWAGADRPAPRVYLVHADQAGRITLDLPGGQVAVSQDEFLALLDLDPVLGTLPLGAPALFLATGPAPLPAGFVTRFAERTGRTAHAAAGPMMLTGPETAPRTVLLMLDPATAGPGLWTTGARTAPGAPHPRSGKSGESLFAPSGQNPTGQASADPSSALASLTLDDTTAASGTALDLPPETLLRNASGNPTGRNLTGTAVRRVRMGSARVVVGDASPDGADSRPAPWGDRAYAVWAESDPAGLRTADGRVLGPEDLAATLAADPELAKLPPDVPIVLVVPGAANFRHLEMLRALARRTGRTVWAPSGEAQLRRTKKGDHVPVLVDRGPGHAVGAWVPVHPDAVSAPPVDRTWTALDGTVFRDDDVDSRPVVSDRDERFGRMSHADDVREREELLRGYAHATRLVRRTPYPGGSKLTSVEPREPAEAAAYTFAAHGLPGGLQLALRDGRTVWLSGEDGGRYIGGLPEVRDLPRDHRMGLEVCWSASSGNPARIQLDNRMAPTPDDPLQELSLAQHTANASRRVVNGSLMSSGIGVGARVLFDTPGGLPGVRLDFHPEPTAAELDAHAVTAGLHTGTGPVPDAARATTLRLVRALRLVFGAEAEADPAGYARLLKGVGALETLRAQDPQLSRFTPFRMELWSAIAQRVAGGRAPASADYRTALDQAVRMLAAPQSGPLSTAIGDPLLRNALAQLAQHGEALVRTVLRRPPQAGPVGPKETAQVLWALHAGARKLAALGPDGEARARRILHLPADQPWTPAGQRQLWFLAAHAVVADVDVNDDTALAALHLTTLGAFAPQHHLVRDGGRFTGFNWSGNPAPGGLDMEAFTRHMPQSDGGVEHRRSEYPWTVQKQEEAAVFWADAHPDGRIVLRLAGQPEITVSDEEFLALLDMAPPLRAGALEVPVALLVPRTTGPGRNLPAAVATRTSRPTWAFTGVLHPDPAPAADGAAPVPLHLLAPPDPDTGQHGRWGRAMPPVPTPVMLTEPLADEAGAPTLVSSPASASTSTVAPRPAADATGTFHLGQAAPAHRAPATRAVRPFGAPAAPPLQRVPRYPAPEQINATPVGTDPVTADPSSALASFSLDDATAPAADEAPWSVPSWRPAGTPGTVRFAAFYQDREWRRRSVQLEFTLAGLMSTHSGITEAARTAASRLYADLTERYGEERAQRAFLDPGIPYENPARALDRLLTLPPGVLALDELMAAYARAAHAGRELPADLAEALARPVGNRAKYAPGSAYRAVHDSRGLRRVGGERNVALRLLQTYAALGASPLELAAFRGALISWLIPADLASLHEILLASHLAGTAPNHARERTSALRDGAGLHLWADASVREARLLSLLPPGDPRAHHLIPPHQALYEARMRYSSRITPQRLSIPGDLLDLVDGALRDPYGLEGDRGQAMFDWLHRNGRPGMRALSELAPAHLTAVFLYSANDYRLMKAYLNGRRLGAGFSRHLVRINTWALMRRAAEANAVSMLPVTLRRLEGAHELYDDMFDVANELGTRSEKVAELRRRAYAFADRLHDELPLHVDMATEALEVLPPVQQDVWWGDRGMPGPLDRPEHGPVYGRDFIDVPFVRSTSLDRDQAFGFMARNKPGPADAHRGMVHVRRSTAREVTPFVAYVSEVEAIYPPGQHFRVDSRTVEPLRSGPAPGYEHITVHETASPYASLPPVRLLGAPDDLLRITQPAPSGPWPSLPELREIRGEDGALIGVASFDDADWAVREPDYRRLAENNGFVAWERDADGRPVASHHSRPGDAGTTFHFASHGGATGLALHTEDGGVRHDDGTSTGLALRPLLGPRFRSVTVLACGPAGAVADRTAARARARRLADATGLPVHLPVGRTAVSDGVPHLLEDAEGRPTEWVTEYPGGRAPSAEAAPSPAPRAVPAVRYPDAGQVNADDPMDVDDKSEEGETSDSDSDSDEEMGSDSGGGTGPGTANPGTTGPGGIQFVFENGFGTTHASGEASEESDSDSDSRSEVSEHSYAPEDLSGSEDDSDSDSEDGPGAREQRPPNLASWRITGAPGSPRFTTLYPNPQWRQLSLNFEFALAQLLGARPEVQQVVRETLGRAHRFLTERHGEEAATRTLFPTPDDQGTQPGDRLARLLGPDARPTLSELFLAYANAVFAAPQSPTTVARTLPGTIRGTGQPLRSLPPAVGHAWHQYDSHGFRRVAGPDGPALWLLQGALETGATPAEAAMLRTALIAWAVPAGVHSLHEVLRASHLLGMGGPEERRAAALDASRLHSWAREHLVPWHLIPPTPAGAALRERLRAPHEVLYSHYNRFPAAVTGELNLPDDLVRMVRDMLAPGSTGMDQNDERLVIGREWLTRYGDAGREALLRLSPGHLTALHVYTFHDYQLMKAYLKGERLGRGMSRWMVRRMVWSLARRGKYDRIPLIMRIQPNFPAIFTGVQQAVGSGDRAQLLRARRHLDAVARGVHAQLPGHIDMTSEALELLPPVNRTVYWGDRAVPGTLRRPSESSALYGGRRITMPFFRSTALERSSALDFALHRGSPPRGMHPQLTEVANSQAREIAMFSSWPKEAEALYPPGVVFDRVRRSILHYGRDRRPFALLRVTEAPGAPMPATAPLPAPDAGPDGLGVLYAHPRWWSLAAEYEHALGRILAQEDAVVDAAREAVRALYAYLADHLGPDAAVSAFPDTDADSDSESLPDADIDPAQRMADLLDHDELDTLLEAFAEAAYGPLDQPGRQSLRRLWHEHPELNTRGLTTTVAPSEPHAPEGSWYRDRHDRLGHPVRDGRATRFEWLLRAYAALPGTDPDRLLELRTALLAERLFDGSHSLAELLEAAQAAGVRDTGEPRPADTGAAELYAWADAVFAPRVRLASDPTLREVLGDDPNLPEQLILPHQRLYRQHTAWLTPWITAGAAEPAAITSLAALDGETWSAADLETLPWPGGPSARERRAALRAWLLRHESPALLRNLTAAHVPALYLASGPDGSLFKAARGTGPEAASGFRQALAETAAKLVGRGEADGMYPLVLLRDNRLRSLARQAARVPAGPGRAAALQPLAQWAGQRAAELADGARAELLLAARMAQEALELLPPVDTSVYYVRLEEGTAEQVATSRPGAVHDSPHILFTSRGNLARLLAAPRIPDGRHLVLHEVRGSTARDVAPFARVPGARRALYPRPARFTEVSRELRHDATTGRVYTHVLLQEAPDQDAAAWEREILTRPVVAPDGTWSGLTAYTAQEWAESRHGLATLPSLDYFKYYDTASEEWEPERVPVPWDNGSVFFAVPSDGRLVRAGSPYGSRLITGGQAGTYLRGSARAVRAALDAARPAVVLV
ncbi:lonely Cys domain-containing protein, partial [Streptomyces minutiscleroticus]|uniref:lonely Cys domain-containing protein n=1 Tax=Streptomyces minutiscleroticus TaxID=68238 RepID=UPI003321ACB2